MYPWQVHRYKDEVQRNRYAAFTTREDALEYMKGLDYSTYDYLLAYKED